jgi:hypothetical protein
MILAYYVPVVTRPSAVWPHHELRRVLLSNPCYLPVDNQLLSTEYQRRYPSIRRHKFRLAVSIRQQEPWALLIPGFIHKLSTMQITCMHQCVSILTAVEICPFKYGLEAWDVMACRAKSFWPDVLQLTPYRAPSILPYYYLVTLL